jgi:hypothetical protein
MAHIHSADHKNEYAKSRMSGEIVGDVDTRTFVEILLDEEIDFFNEKHNSAIAEMAADMTLKDEDEENEEERSELAKIEGPEDMEMSDDSDQLQEQVEQIMDDLQANMS